MLQLRNLSKRGELRRNSKLRKKLRRPRLPSKKLKELKKSLKLLASGTKKNSHLSPLRRKLPRLLQRRKLKLRSLLKRQPRMLESRPRDYMNSLYRLSVMLKLPL